MISFDTVKASLHRLALASHQVSLCICIYLPVEEFVMLTTITLKKNKKWLIGIFISSFLEDFSSIS